jgi:hypothetical protein
VRAKTGVPLAFGSNECLQLGLGDQISERKKPGVVQGFQVCHNNIFLDRDARELIVSSFLFIRM